MRTTRLSLPPVLTVLRHASLASLRPGDHFLLGRTGALHVVLDRRGRCQRLGDLHLLTLPASLRVRQLLYHAHDTKV